MVNERTAGRFDHAHAFQGVYAGCCAHMRVENLRIVKESFDAFQGKDNFNDPGVMVEERTMRHWCRNADEIR